MVKIRLARRGRKKLALYDIVVADARAPRDGKFIEKLGTYNPNTQPATIVLHEANAVNWLLNGAQPTDTARAILAYKGVMFRKHLQVGVLKGALSQEQADEKYTTWRDDKENRINAHAESIEGRKAEVKKLRMEGESRKNNARAEELARKKAPVVVETPAEEAPVAAAEPTPAAEEAVAVVIQETPAEAVTENSQAAEEAVAVATQETPVAEAVAENSQVAEEQAAEKPLEEETRVITEEVPEKPADEEETRKTDAE